MSAALPPWAAAQGSKQLHVLLGASIFSPSAGWICVSCWVLMGMGRSCRGDVTLVRGRSVRLRLGLVVPMQGTSGSRRRARKRARQAAAGGARVVRAGPRAQPAPVHLLCAGGAADGGRRGRLCRWCPGRDGAGAVLTMALI